MTKAIPHDEPNADAAPEIRLRRDDRAAIARELQAFIVRDPEVFGGADIYCLDFGTPVARVGMLAAVLTGLVDPDRRPAVRRFVVVVAPGSDAALSVALIDNVAGSSSRMVTDPALGEPTV